MSETRKLAAIMFTDIAGFTALMGADEQKALRVLSQSRALILRLLPQFHGALIEHVGDGTVCSFQSTLEAVRCAGAIQEALRNEPDLRVRVGIHVGDVLFSADEVIGDGVNVASRIHALAEPGGICVSEQVYDAVRNQPDLRATSLGERHLRNVNRPIRVYVLRVAHSAAAGDNGTGPPAEPHAAEPLPVPSGERRQLTLVCCRLTLTALDPTAVDVEDTDRVLRGAHAACADIADAHEGHIASVMGDRLLIVFGYPRAREDDARRAVRAARQIVSEIERTRGRLEAERRLRLEIRIGVHTGLVVLQQQGRTWSQGLSGIVGPTPEVAATLVDHARPGEILVSHETQRLLRGEIQTEPAGVLDVPGVPRNLPVFLLRSQGQGVRSEIIPPAGETPLVGRARQLGELLEAWARTQAGQAEAVFVRGEPGIGKSRLVRELHRQVPGDAWLECHGVVENRETPLCPLIELLATVEEPLESLLAHYGFDLDETVPLFTALVSRPTEREYRQLVVSPERQKELTLQALLGLFLKMAEARPLVLAVEDLQWADPTTLELVGLLLQEVRTTRLLGTQPAPRVCVVITARQEFEPPWPVEGVSMVQLSPLTHGEVEEMIAAGFDGSRPIPPAVVDAIVQRADGIPLFVEEMTRVLVEASALSAGLDPVTPDRFLVEIPSSLRDLLTARLDNLSPAARETAQLAALLGREFRYEVLRAVSSKPEASLREDLTDLSAAGLLFHRYNARRESYVFKHALVRDTAYESMMRRTREALHLRVAQVLRERFADIEALRPEILAQHFERGGDLATAVDYWHRAGDGALKRAAYVEATQQLDHALAVLRTVAESPARDRQEIEVLTTLGTVLFLTRGHAAPEVEHTFSRARVLCERLGEDLSLKVLAGIASVYMVRSDREATAALLPRFERLAARTDDVVASITGHAVLGGAAFWRGDFVDAGQHLAIAEGFYGTAEFKRFSLEYGYDGGFFIYPYLMSILWHLGYPDKAETRGKESLAIAEASGNPYSILLALAFAATMTHNLGQPEATAALADRLIALSTEQHLYVWSAFGMLARGGALAQEGEPGQAIPLLTQGLDICRAVGFFGSYSYYLTYLAEAHVQAGNIAAGLAVVDEGQARCQTDLTRFHESELHRLRGDLLARQGNVDAATASYQRALDVAHHQHARSMALRAAIGLCRLLREQGNRAEGHAVLARVYGSFTEGFATMDLRTARALLAELA